MLLSDLWLSESMAALPEPPADSSPPHWDYWRHDLWRRVQHEPPTQFMSWPCVYHTMLVNHFDMSGQMAALAEDWVRYGAAVTVDREEEMTDRKDIDGQTVSLSLIEQAAHLQVWERITSRRVEDLSAIFEFGAGYGAMAWVAHRLGFEGDYYTYDLPEFALLQRWFLARRGIAVEHVDGPPDLRKALLIAAYSISEASLGQRAEFLNTPGVDSLLLVYSPQFADIDNVAYFSKLIADWSDWEWTQQPVAGRPDVYLIGQRKKLRRRRAG